MKSCCTKCFVLYLFLSPEAGECVDLGKANSAFGKAGTGFTKI